MKSFREINLRMKQEITKDEQDLKEYKELLSIKKFKSQRGSQKSLFLNEVQSFDNQTDHPGTKSPIFRFNSDMMTPTEVRPKHRLIDSPPVQINNSVVDNTKLPPF